MTAIIMRAAEGDPPAWCVLDVFCITCYFFAPFSQVQPMVRKPKIVYGEIEEAEDVARSFAPISERELRDITALVLREYRCHHNLRIYEELPIERGGSRVDFATVNEITHAYELKSDADSVDKLSNQIHAYGRVFDRVTIVVAPRLLKEVKGLVPKWWGIIAAHRIIFGDVVVLNGIRSAGENPAQDPHSVASMLWRDEAIALIEQIGAPQPKPKVSRTDLYEQIARDVSLPQIREFVAKALYERKATKAAK